MTKPLDPDLKAVRSPAEHPEDYRVRVAQESKFASPAENAATVPDSQLRTKLVAALNGYTVDADTGWAIIKRFDALLAQAEAAADSLTRWQSRAHYWNERAEKAEADRDAAVRERDLLQRQLDAVDANLPPWEAPPDSQTGVVGRVQTILNLKADRRTAEHAQALLVEHHAAGAMDGVLAGDKCPVCARAVLSAREEGS